jgi:phage terminase large subunit-like protein
MLDVYTLGWQIIDWVETMLCHGPGDVEGEPYVFDDEFAAVLVRAYQLDRESGRRLIHRYILSRSKGRAKSELGGILVCAEALGPVRFSHRAVKGETSWWGYHYEPGEPVGKPVKRPFIRCLATEESQAGNTYENVLYMLTSENAAITSVSRVDAGLTRTYLPAGGEIRPSTASNSAKDGGKETFVVFDETHLYVLPELRAMHATVRRNCVKRKEAQPWSLETTTMFEQGAGSVAESTFHAYEAGQLKDLGIIFDHRSGPDPSTFDWHDDAALKAALAEAYGPAAEWMDLDRIVIECRDPETTRSDAERFFLNRPSSLEDDVTPLDVWDALVVSDRLLPGDTICVGFDGSERKDSTSIVATRAADGLTVPLGLWERPLGARDWEVNRAWVGERMAWVFDTYRVVRCYCDPRYWESDIDEWQERWGDKVVLPIPSSDSRRARAADRWESLVATSLQRLRRGESPGSETSLCHDGNSDMRRHVGNARRERLGGRAGKEGGWRPSKKKQDRKIDLLDAAMLAHEARGDALANGELFPVEDPGLIVF